VPVAGLLFTIETWSVVVEFDHEAAPDDMRRDSDASALLARSDRILDRIFDNRLGDQGGYQSIPRLVD
jgi:hypothetical protein